MSIRVLADGADGYRLLNPDDVIVGWVRGRAIGVAGFTDQPSTIVAALTAFGKLAAWAKNERQFVMPTIEGQTISVVHDGAYKWLAAGHVPIARLLVLSPIDFASAPEHAFELVLHGQVSEGTAIRAALIAVETLTGANETADISWPPRQFATPPPVTRLKLDGQVS
jgi:hypothetical protein